jgi:hypothetical protein
MFIASTASNNLPIKNSREGYKHRPLAGLERRTILHLGDGRSVRFRVLGTRYSAGAPESFQAFQPPAIDQTFV